MSKTLHLHCRKGVWYYRRRVPDALIAAGWPKYVQQSLRTTSPKVALRQRTIRALEWDAKFEAAEDALARAPAGGDPVSKPSPKVLSEPLAIRLIQEYVEKTDSRRAQRSPTDRPLSREEWEEAEQDLEIELAIAQGRATPYDHDEYISRAYEEVLAAANVAVDEQTFPAAAMSDLVRRACIELEKRALARFRDERRYRFFDDLFDPKPHREASELGRLLSSVSQRDL